MTLVKEMLNYGAKAQEKFGVLTDDLANKDVTDYEMQEVTPEMVQAAIAAANPNKTTNKMNKGTEAFGLQYLGSTVVCLTKTTLRHYYTVTNQAVFDEAKADASFTLNDSKAPFIIFEQSDIAASDLDKYQEFTIGGQTYYYSVLDYMLSMMTSKNSGEADKALAAAAYFYNQAANEYFKTYSVRLISHGQQKNKVAILIVNLTGMSLQDAVALVVNAPSVIGEFKTEAEAQLAVDKLTALGATAEYEVN